LLKVNPRNFSGTNKWAAVQILQMRQFQFFGGSNDCAKEL